MQHKPIQTLELEHLLLPSNGKEGQLHKTHQNSSAEGALELKSATKIMIVKHLG